MAKRKKAFLIDAYNIIFRSYYAIKHMHNKDGQPVNALYGYLNILLKIINNGDCKKDAFLVAADTGKKNFRHAIYKDYKANRKQIDNDLVSQFSLIEEATKKLGINYLSKEGFEADDLIASISQKLKNQDIEIIIVSSDKDLYQLLDEDVKMMDPVSMKTIDKEFVMEKTGVTPEQIPDLLALQGDSSDNIPGINGIGPKTAAKILKDTGSIENIINKDFRTTDKKILKHINNIDNKAIIFKKLTTLKRDIEIPSKDIEGKIYQEISNNEEFRSLLEKHNFSSILSRLYTNNQSKNISQEFKSNNFEAINPDSFLKHVMNFDGIIKIEINSSDEIIMTNSQNNFLIVKNKECLDSSLLDLLLDKSILKVSDNASRVLKIIPNIEHIHDLRVMNYAIETSTSLPHNSESSIEDFKQLRKRIILNETFNIYELIDRPMIKVLHKMETEGALIELSVLENVKKNLTAIVSKIEQKIFNLAKTNFNIASNKQLSDILINKFGLSLKKNSKTQNYIIDAHMLEEIEEAGVEVASLILEWRKLVKIITTYAEGLKKYVNERTSKIHTTYNLTGTSTGRISSNNPNMQNIPIKTNEGRDIRKAIIASKDSLLLSADYSQIELRILAHIAKETTMLQQLKNDEDIHDITAQQIFPNLEKTQSRRMAKIVNFGIIYGISPFGLARQLGISHLSAKIIIDKYFDKYQMIKKYLNSTIEFAKEHGYVKTIFGRKCKIEGLSNPNVKIKKFSERSAINAPIQGSAADIVKIAMKKIDSFIEAENLRSRLILQIHDEIIIDAYKEESHILANRIKQIMENEINIAVPLKINIKMGPNMLEMS